MKTTIGFFGDSFCTTRTNYHSMYYGYSTYINKLVTHYDATIVNVGHGGTSIWDTLLLQLTPLIETDSVPDICIFVWTIPGRLFNRKVRRLNQTDAIYPKLHTFNPFYYKIWNAAKQFYEHLHDYEKEELELVSALRYIDSVVLPKIANKQIVHLWTAGKTNGWDRNGIRPSAITYHHTWTHGSEIRPSMLSLSLYDNDIKILQTDYRANHLDGEFKNQKLYEWIVTALDQNSGINDYSLEIDKLYDISPEVHRRAI